MNQETNTKNKKGTESNEQSTIYAQQTISTRTLVPRSDTKIVGHQMGGVPEAEPSPLPTHIDGDMDKCMDSSMWDLNFHLQNIMTFCLK